MLSHYCWVLQVHVQSIIIVPIRVLVATAVGTLIGTTAVNAFPHQHHCEQAPQKINVQWNPYLYIVCVLYLPLPSLQLFDIYEIFFNIICLCPFL